MEVSIDDLVYRFSLIASYATCFLIFPIWKNRSKIDDKFELFTTIMLTAIILTQLYMNITRDFFHDFTALYEYTSDILELTFAIVLFSHWFGFSKSKTIISLIVVVPAILVASSYIPVEFIYKDGGEWKTYENPSMVLLYLHVILVSILALTLRDKKISHDLTKFQIRLFGGLRLYAIVTVLSVPLMLSSLYLLGYAFHSFACVLEFYQFYKGYKCQ